MSCRYPRKMTAHAPNERIPSQWEEITAADSTHSTRYVERFRSMRADGKDIVGEARLIDAMLGRGGRVLDAGCGPGRLGGYLHDVGHVVVGVDVDPVLMLPQKKTTPDRRGLSAISPNSICRPAVSRQISTSSCRQATWWRFSRRPPGKQYCQDLLVISLRAAEWSSDSVPAVATSSPSFSPTRPRVASRLICCSPRGIFARSRRIPNSWSRCSPAPDPALPPQSLRSVTRRSTHPDHNGGDCCSLRT